MPPFSSSFLLTFFFFSFSLSFTSSLNSDGLSLLALKAAIESDPSHVLESWSEFDSTPCHWPGIVCTRDRVTQLSLPNKALTGYIPSEIGLLDSLRRLNLAFNNFSKPIPSHLFNATNLVVLDLSHNSLSGILSDQIGDLRKLRHLDFSSNFLNGSLPNRLTELTELVGTLNLSYNRFSGEVPSSFGNLPLIVNLDVRHNNLTGKIPQVGSLLNQGPTAFSDNPSLCGFPLQTPCPEAQNPNVFPENPQNPKSVNGNFPGYGGGRENAGGGVAGSGMVAVVSSIFAVVGVVSLTVWWFRRKGVEGRAEEGKSGKGSPERESLGESEGQNGKFVVMDEGMNLELEDLLRASAYVVGKSRSGIVYKVVAGRGSSAGASIVAVRRLNDGDATLTLKDFEYEIESIGRVQHPNIVRLRAYYYAADEKLLVTDFIKNGSLHTALHGSPSSSLSPLPWSARLKIAQGAARGLAYIHEFGARKYVHGNIKSTKILLDDDFEPYISGFGLSRLGQGAPKFTPTSSKKLSSNQNMISSIMGSSISSPSAIYLAPEVREFGGKYTQKCDVYSFGIVILELLSGRLADVVSENDGKGLECFVRKAFQEERPLTDVIDPALVPEIYAKKQVVSTFHIALNCTELDPELRPRMRMVSECLDRIKSQ
ncbi:receptor protein kinase-like protein ZAR1 [Cucurbita pepo subsp. pepo]|uniref:receptor protein kinase-like protein ZAR1 n=1 Tax=Cucurbita pepo subsp. pepo TaxID=3664 RepID=UPI000C9D858C|nr:receptor protein kinase-like protein ZAR1 [Cucurbita pepo subsp. pepo]